MPHHNIPDSLRRLAPELADISEQLLFGNIWQRPALSARDRSLITVATLAALGRLPQLRWHTGFAQQNGVTRDELSELFTHLAFYAGWPAAVSGLDCMEGESDGCPLPA